MISLLPADIYTVINRASLDNQDRKNLITLYEPIIGSIAVALYLTLVSDLDKLEIESKDFTHHHLMCLMKIDLASLKRAREALESVGLLKTYYKEGDVSSYIYEVYSPLRPKEFFDHPIFNVVLYNNIGKKEYDSIKNVYQKINFNYNSYQDITKSINDTFKSSNTVPEFDVRDKEYQKVGAKDVVDFDSLIACIPKGIINQRAFNKNVKELINNLAFIYNLDTLKMAEIIRSTINENGFIDSKVLRIKTREYYTYMNNGKLPTLIYRSQPEYLKNPKGDNSNKAKMIYVFENTSPYDFLKSKYRGATPTQRDLKLVEELCNDQGLKPAVVNVLIDYALAKNNNKLTRSYIETIAGQWKRSNIETAEQAMEFAKKENSKKTTKSVTSTTKVKKEEKDPIWLKKDIKKEELTSDELKELEELVKGIG